MNIRIKQLLASAFLLSVLTSTLAECLNSNQKRYRLNNEKEEVISKKKTQQSSESIWINVQKQVKDTVVQIFTNTIEFNWIEPYKTPNQSAKTGTGFFINTQGDIITNYHVVAKALSIQFQIPSFGMERFDAKLIGASPDRDIALLKVTEESLKKIRTQLPIIPCLELGDSDVIVRSQEVLALGYPFGQAKLKSTLGIVSGRERLGSFGYIQVTTPINPGNSGGPALNSDGLVIGINTRCIQEAQNIGYIIPISEVKTIINHLYHVPILHKPPLGGFFAHATPETIKFLGNPAEGGWYIADVFAHSLLKDMGVQAHDMLYEINGYKVDLYGELNVPWSEDKVSVFEFLNRYTIGDILKLLIYRQGEPLEFSLELNNNYSPAIRRIYTEFESEATDYEVLGGMVLMNLTLNHLDILIPHIPRLISYTGGENQQKSALIITHILPNSQAYKARGLLAGDIIQEINGVQTTSLIEFRDALRTSKETRYLTIKTSDKVFSVLSIDKILDDEAILAWNYFYKKSSLLDDLIINTIA